MKGKTSQFVRNIAKNIKKYKKTSYSKLAKKAGINFSTLEKIIYPRVQDVQVGTLSKIATALGVKVDDLIR
ncbi:helix-turn-helix transcriptional regulator [bacterium]|nr:helix-turn-helix transcriptional regulator [bacterium]